MREHPGRPRQRVTAGALRHLPNVLSAARIVAAPVLAWLAAGGHVTAFTWLLVPALLSDAVDGRLARAYGLQSRLGAMLDSAGDSLLLLASLYGIWRFHPELIREHAAAIGLTFGLWLLEDVIALARYGRLSSFHTYLSKAAGVVLGTFIGVLFVFGFQPWLLHLTVATCIVASCEELALLALLPEWRHDVGGLLPVLRERRRGQVS